MIVVSTGARQNTDIRVHTTSTPTIINIIQILMRVIRVVHNKRPSQTVAHLRRQVRVVPERASLIGDVEVVYERLVGRYGALCDKGGAVGPGCAMLGYTVPMLNKR
jgi:hypothetical protein